MHVGALAAGGPLDQSGQDSLGQLLAAAAIAKSWVVLVYLPYLVLAGLITGTLTGLCAQLVVGRLSRN